MARDGTGQSTPTRRLHLYDSGSADGSGAPVGCTGQPVGGSDSPAPATETTDEQLFDRKRVATVVTGTH